MLDVAIITWEEFKWIKKFTKPNFIKKLIIKYLKTLKFDKSIIENE